MPRVTHSTSLTLALLAMALLAGCYRYHERGVDAGPGDAGQSRCGSGRCALREARRITITTSGLVGRVEAEVSNLREAPEIDGVAFDLDPCAPMRTTPCPRTITVSNTGTDLALPAVLSGAVEASIRDGRVVVRSDPCPGCDDGHVAGRLLFAASEGPESEGFDLPLNDVTIEAGEEVCRSRGSIGEATGRYTLEVASIAPAVRATLDEGETARLGLSDYAVRLVRSSYECVGPDLPPPAALEAVAWVLWIEGPR